MTRFVYRQSMRLRLPAEYERVYAAQQKRGDGHLLLFAASNGLGESRYGTSVSRRHGNAVKRIRLKRLLREACRLSQHHLPKGFDFVLIPRHESRARLEDYRASLERLGWKLARAIPAQQEASRET